MAMVSNISYPITFLIRQAKAGKLKNSSRVLERFQLVRDGDLSSGPMSPKEFLEIVEDNRDCIEREYCSQKDIESSHGWFNTLNHWVDVEEAHGFPGSLSLLEFDDHNDAHRLAYGLVVNRIQKRIVVVFRGTYADGTDDWKRNMQSDKVEIPVPPNLLQREKQQGGKPLQQKDLLPSTIKIHRGLYEYLFDNPNKGPRFERERYEEITTLLSECLRENPDYDVYVTGHSLGGGLAEIFAFYFSATIATFEADLPTTPRITCVCVGSMLAGDESFAMALCYLEQTERLRYLRVIKGDDPVCYFPPLEGYTPSGLQLLLNRDHGHVLWHPRTRRKFVPTALDSADEGDRFRKHLHRDTIGTVYACTTDGDMAETANSWPNLIRALVHSLHRGTDFFRHHMVPSYLGQLEREREYLSQITLDGLHHEVEPIDSTQMDE